MAAASRRGASCSREPPARNPLRHLPSSAAPLVVAVGLGELPELVRQSAEFADAWRRCGLRGSYLPVARHDHFSILEALARPDGVILAALKKLALTP
jgi:arylformamidase